MAPGGKHATVHCARRTCLATPLWQTQRSKDALGGTSTHSRPWINAVPRNLSRDIWSNEPAWLHPCPWSKLAIIRFEAARIWSLM